MVAWICDSIDKAAWIRHGVMSVAYREPAEPDGRDVAWLPGIRPGSYQSANAPHRLSSKAN
jgi:hypothetical protein